MIRLMVVYHAGAMDNALDIWGKLAQQPNLSLTVVVPREIALAKVYEPSGWLRVEPRQPRAGYLMVPVRLRVSTEYRHGFEAAPLRQVLREVRPDIIHALDEATSGYLHQLIWQRLRVAPRAKVLFYAFQNLPFRLRGILRWKWKLAWAQMAGGVGASSESLATVRAAGFPAGRPLERVPWGVSTANFCPMLKDPLKKELRVPYEHVVGFVGRLAAEKGLAVLLAAMRHMPKTVGCLLIGEGPMRPELELWSGVSDLVGRIQFLGPVPAHSLPKFMNCFDVLVLPSLTTARWKEQYGRVIAEAMACGVPVVGSNSGAIPEVIGEAGVVFPEGDLVALAEALHSAIFDTEKRRTLSKRGLERVREELSTEAMAARLAAFYSRIVEG